MLTVASSVDFWGQPFAFRLGFSRGRGFLVLAYAL